MVTHVIDNIDWKNKSTNESESHHTNSIIIQESTFLEKGSTTVALGPDYNFNRQEHRSFKGSNFNVPNVKFKRSLAKLLEFESDLTENNVRG